MDKLKHIISYNRKNLSSPNYNPHDLPNVVVLFHLTLKFFSLSIDHKDNKLYYTSNYIVILLYKKLHLQYLHQYHHHPQGPVEG